MTVMYVLWLRELKRYWRSRTQIAVSLASPCLYLFVLGFGLRSVFESSGRGNYLEFIAPGVIGMGIMFTSVAAGLGLLWDRRFGFLRETLVAPVSRFHVMAGRAAGAATVAMLQGSLILAIASLGGFRPAGVAAVPLALLFMALVAIVFSALGVLIGSMLRDMQAFQLVINFLIAPMFFSSGALFPLENLPVALTVVARLNPLSYGVDGLRSALGAFEASPGYGMELDLGVLCAVATVLLGLGAWSFSRIQA